MTESGERRSCSSSANRSREGRRGADVAWADSAGSVSSAGAAAGAVDALDEISRAASRPGAANRNSTGASRREGSLGSGSDHASTIAAAGTESAAKNRAAERPSACHASASLAGTRMANGLLAPPVAAAATRIRPRSMVRESARSRLPNMRSTAGRVVAKSRRRQAADRAASGAAAPAERAIVSAAKRRKRPEAAIREDAPRAAINPDFFPSRGCPRVRAAHADRAVGQGRGVQRAQLERASFDAARLEDLGGPPGRRFQRRRSLERDAAVREIEDGRGAGPLREPPLQAQLGLLGREPRMPAPLRAGEVGLFAALVEAQVRDLQQEVDRLAVPWI